MHSTRTSTFLWPLSVLTVVFDRTKTMNVSTTYNSGFAPRRKVGAICVSWQSSGLIPRGVRYLSAIIQDTRSGVHSRPSLLTGTTIILSLLHVLTGSSRVVIPAACVLLERFWYRPPHITVAPTAQYENDAIQVAFCSISLSVLISWFSDREHYPLRHKYDQSC